MIVGAGPAGSAAAIFCAQHGLRVALLEQSAVCRDRPGETLPPGIEPLLQQLGIAHEIFAGEFLFGIPETGCNGVQNVISMLSVASPIIHGVAFKSPGACSTVCYSARLRHQVYPSCDLAAPKKGHPQRRLRDRGRNRQRCFSLART
ncbi:NAD(P)-binding protein [Pseudomonas lini]